KKDAELYQRIFGNLHRCKECKYLTRSMFCLQNHLKRHKIKGKKFSCQESPPEEYFCTECTFSTHLKAYFKQHIREYHYLKKESEEIKLDLKTCTCENCPFWTYSSLVLLKHQLNGKCGNREGTEKRSESVVCDGVNWYIC